MNCKQQNNFPSSWQQVKLGDICIISAGGTPSTNISHYWDNGNIPWANSAEINKREIYQTDNFITDEGFRNSSAKKVPVNSILIALAGQGSTRGKVAVNKIPITTNQSIAFCVPKEDIHYGFIRADLERRYKELRSVSAGNGGRGGLNLQIIKNINIKIPHFLEQVRIVSVLETWDKAIEKLSKKIQIKKQVKKGLMQDLLTGKRKVKECYDKWETLEFNDLFYVLKKPNGFKYEEYGINGEFPIIDQSKDREISGYTNRKDRVYDFSKKPVIIFGDHSRVIKFVNYRVSFGNDGIKLFQTKNNCDMGFGYYLLLNLRIPETGYNRHFKYINSAIFEIPKSIEEQEAIANILITADKEIQLLEKKLQVIKNQKNYLLNNLVTGKIRTRESMKV